MARLSKRQVIRIVHKLREKSLIAFDENKGGLSKQGTGKSHKYRLLIACKDDIQKGDILKSAMDEERRTKGDISNGNSDILNTRTVTFSSPKGDAIVSPEWVEWFHEWGFKGGKTPPPHNHDVIAELEDKTEELMEKIESGIPVRRLEECVHGPFHRTGYRFKNWIAWVGHEQVYGGGWIGTECKGCQSGRRGHLFTRHFDLRAAAFCPDHGCFVFEAVVREHSQEHAEIMESRWTIELGECPQCLSETLSKMEAQTAFDLSDEDWAVGGRQIMEAIELARA